MTDYDIEIDIIYDIQGDKVGFEVTTKAGKYVYTVDELEGTNLLNIIRDEKVTVYGQEQEYTKEEHMALYGW